MKLSKRDIASGVVAVGVAEFVLAALRDVFTPLPSPARLALAYAVSVAVIAAGLWAERKLLPAVEVPGHFAAPQGRVRRAVAAVMPDAVWRILPARVQGALCGCREICRGGEEQP